MKDTEDTNGDGKTLPQWTDGRVGTALDFDGVDDMVSVPKNFDLDTLTYSFWVNPAASQGDNNRIVSQSSGPALTFIRQTDKAVVFRVVSNSGTDHEINSDPLETEEWSHVVATFANGEQNIYVNGDREGTETRSFTELDSGNDMSIASDDPSGSLFLDGTIDEVAIHSRALQPNELYTLSISR